VLADLGVMARDAAIKRGELPVLIIRQHEEALGLRANPQAAVD
jgi:hypothetical protein